MLHFENLFILNTQIVYEGRFLVWFQTLKFTCWSVLGLETESQIALDIAPSVYECVWVINAPDEQVVSCLVVTATSVWMCVDVCEWVNAKPVV